MVVAHQRPPRERSLITTMHTEEQSDTDYTVYADCILTRRKRHHMICDSVDSVLFRSRWWSDIVEWLADAEIDCYKLVTDRDRYTVTVRREQQRKGR